MNTVVCKGNWRSIDSAPRDGSRHLGRDKDGKVFWCRFWTSAELSEYEDDLNTEYEAGFFEYIGIDGDDGQLVNPTHWCDEL